MRNYPSVGSENLCLGAKLPNNGAGYEGAVMVAEPCQYDYDTAGSSGQYFS